MKSGTAGLDGNLDQYWGAFRKKSHLLLNKSQVCAWKSTVLMVCERKE